MLDQLTWPAAFTIVSSLIVIAGTLIKIFKREEDPDISDVKDRLTELETNKVLVDNTIEELQKEDEELKGLITESNETCRSSFEKLESKQEKMGDYVIELFRNHNS